MTKKKAKVFDIDGTEIKRKTLKQQLEESKKTIKEAEEKFRFLERRKAALELALVRKEKHRKNDITAFNITISNLSAQLKNVRSKTAEGQYINTLLDKIEEQSQMIARNEEVYEAMVENKKNLMWKIQRLRVDLSLAKPVGRRL